MALHINCDVCSEELNETGGLLFEPPDKAGAVFKFHLCRKCWNELITWIGKKQRDNV